MAKTDIVLRLYQDRLFYASVEGDRMRVTDAYGWDFKVGDIVKVDSVPYVITSVEEDRRWDPAPYRRATARRIY